MGRAWILGVGLWLVFEYFAGGVSDYGGIRALSVGVRGRVLTSLYSLSSEVILHRYLALAASL